MPVTFDLLTARDRDWGLDDFVAEVNRLLPEVVPGDTATRAKAEVSARLVRHYATEGVLPKPLKEGVEARYDGDHLVRVLALRRLLLEGYPSAVAGAFLQRHDRERLARFLLGELRLDLDLTPGGPPVQSAPADLSPDARAQLAAMRARAGLPPLPDAAAPATTRRLIMNRSSSQRSAPPAAPASPEATDGDLFAVHGRPDPGRAPAAAPPPAVPAERGVAWTRYPLLPGLELHVQDGFVDPTTPAAWNALRNAILARLEAIALERSMRR
ncbi:MAG: MerR family transcriptional regulator [Trueperaceae bacterium]|nr:MerR family transcriptional regulator [Trueperaceae bacterium]